MADGYAELAATNQLELEFRTPRNGDVSSRGYSEPFVSACSNPYRAMLSSQASCYQDIGRSSSHHPYTPHTALGSMSPGRGALPQYSQSPGMSQSPDAQNYILAPRVPQSYIGYSSALRPLEAARAGR